MRPAFFAVTILACASSTALGQTGPYTGTVTQTGAVLRAGPSEQFPVTCTLKPGDTLLVDHEEENGWLATLDGPGKMYSLSWVQNSLVEFDKTKPTPQNVAVTGDAVLAAGKFGTTEPMTDWRRTKIPEGTILTIIGPKVQSGGKWWFPVAPPSGDFRYIPKQMVQADKQVNTSFTIRSVPDATLPAAATPASSKIPPQPVAVTPASGTLPPTIPVVGPPASSLPPIVSSPPIVSTPPVKPVVVNDPLWAQAEQAEQDGRLNDAEKLYFELARKMNETGGDHDIANLCYTRIHSIRERKRVSGSTGSTSSNRSVLTDSPKTSVSGVSQRPDYIGTGKLSRSALDVDGKFTYVLDGSPGVPIAYVIAGSGVDLTRFAGKQVSIYGGSTTRKDLAKPLVTATSAEPAP
jgi:hypothetical protein